MSADSPLYLQVAVPRRLHRIFTYAVPRALAGTWTPGMRVQVPFGKSVLTGYVVAVTSSPGTGGKPTRIREIIARLEEAPSIAPDLLALTEWLSERYLAPLGQCLRLAFPGAPERTRSATRVKQPDAVASAPDVPVAARPAFDVHRATHDDRLVPLREKVLAAIGRERHERVLLPAAADELFSFYPELIQATLDRGRTALVLVPEAGWVEAHWVAFEARWGARCQAYHGGLSLGDRRKAWARIQQGEATVAIGTRSAVFAPLARVGLIIVAQEDHPAYKAENVPRYDARTVAAERARRAGAVLVLASAHPSLETMQATGMTPRALLSRSPQPDAPPVTVADLRDMPFGEILSPPLSQAIEASLAGGKTVLLFLNRKGYASVLLCRDCGQAVQCPTCSVGWTFHKHESMLRCSHCGREGKAPETCPACAGSRLVPAGSGTEALEETVTLRFPAARVARLERQRAGGDRANAAILSLWQAGELDILISTQLAVTRRPRPVASLVGLVYPDAAFHLPDFRAAERAYHTLREVLALADPRDPDAAIVIQTHVPQHHVIQALAQRDPAIFYESELAARQALGYPPFGRLIGLRVSGTKEELVAAAAVRWASLLRLAGKVSAGGAPRVPVAPPNATGDGPPPTLVEVLGPIPATPARMRGRFRRQLMVKGTDAAALRQAVRSTLAELETTGRAGALRYDIDVDPQSLM